MCKTCNGTGGITINFGWYTEFHPCKNPDCDFDREKAQRESDALLARMKAEILAMEDAS